jgi:aspartate-semialdehyde dehydrogenase
MIVSTYQAASGAGAAAMEELKEQTRDVLEGREAKPVIFPYQVRPGALVSLRRQLFNLGSHS